MAECKWCKKKGFFVTVTKQGVCPACSAAINIEVESRKRVIQESVSLAEKSKNKDTQLSRLQLVEENCAALMKYTHAGINVMTPTPDELIRSCIQTRNEFVMQYIQEAIESASIKADVAATTRSKITAFTKAMETIGSLEKYADDKDGVYSSMKLIKGKVHSLQLNDYIAAAEKYEFKDQHVKALDQYQEALYFVKTDDIDDSVQSSEIKKIESKIIELKAKLNK